MTKEEIEFEISQLEDEIGELQDQIEVYNGMLKEIENEEKQKNTKEQEPKGEWIPVSERLPEDETEVLVCSNLNNIAVCIGSRSTEIKGAFIWYTSSWMFGEVVAWQPLPKPYKESEGLKDDHS